MDRSNLNKYELMSLYYTLKSVGKTDPSLLVESPKIQSDNTPESRLSEYEVQRREMLLLPNLLVEEERPKNVKIVYKPQKLFDQEEDTDASDLKLQDELSGILSQQSRQLLQNTRILNQELEKSSLDEMENRLGNINDRVTKARKGISQITRKTWRATIMIWLAILVAVLIFAWMLIYMRFSRVKRSLEDL